MVAAEKRTNYADWITSRSGRTRAMPPSSTREQIQAVLEFAARSLDAPPVPVGAALPVPHRCEPWT